jgi:hypothetical protein
MAQPRGLRMLIAQADECDACERTLRQLHKLGSYEEAIGHEDCFLWIDWASLRGLLPDNIIGNYFDVMNNSYAKCAEIGGERDNPEGWEKHRQLREEQRAIVFAKVRAWVENKYDTTGE